MESGLYPGIRSSGMFLNSFKEDQVLIAFWQSRKQTASYGLEIKHSRLYGEKEREYQSGNVTPFLDFALFEKIENEIKGLKIWEITPDHIQRCEDMMIDFTKKKKFIK